MSVLRIRCSLQETEAGMEWAVVGAAGIVSGEGAIPDMHKRASRVEIVIPAADVLITRAALPKAARRRGGATLAYAIEEDTLGDAEAHQVSLLGTSEASDVLAVVDRARYEGRLDELRRAGLTPDAIYCETLLLPWRPREWSVGWNGAEGFVRTGAIEGAATDAGDRAAPPLSLRLMVGEAAANGGQPVCIAVYPTAAGAEPDVEAWQAELGLPVLLEQPWDWRTAAAGRHAQLAQQRDTSRGWARGARRLRPAAVIAIVALAIHAFALVLDWASLAAEQRALTRQMESRFRAIFPDSVAVADPALQMRRKLAQARHAAGRPDSADFLPLIGHVASAARDLPPASIRLAVYEAGRLTLHLNGVDPAALQALVGRLTQAGLHIDAGTPPRSADGMIVLSVGGA